MGDFAETLSHIKEGMKDLIVDIDKIIIKKQEELKEKELNKSKDKSATQTEKKQGLNFKSMTNITRFISNEEKGEDPDITHIKKALDKTFGR